eukprot:g1377.t1
MLGGGNSFGAGHAESNYQDHGEPLQAMATRGRAQLVRLLLARRADPNATDDRSWTPLTSAAARGHRSAVLALLAASSTAKRSAGPLGAAARAGHSEVVKLLLEHHFDPEEPFEGFLPLQWAEAAQHTNVLELLTSTRSARRCHASRRTWDAWQAAAEAEETIPRMAASEASIFGAHPLAFAHADVCGVLHCSVEVLRTLTGLQVPHEMRPWLEGVLRSQLLMLSHGFNTVSFRKGPQPSHQGPALEAAQACHQQFGEFVRQHPVAELCELASRAALKLPQEEVQEWLQEPEDQLLGANDERAAPPGTSAAPSNRAIEGSSGRAWASDIPNDCLMSVLQLLQAFLSAESPKAVRLAALSPVRVLLERFSDHEAWTQVQSNLIDSTLALLSIVSSPEIQWRCLNLVNLFLVEEAESGRYQVTERTMQQLLELWRRPEEGEFLIRHALLDVLRALVLMSCRSRSPRLPLSPPLLSCCLTVISDCYAVHRGQSNSGYEASAALQAEWKELDRERSTEIY